MSYEMILSKPLSTFFQWYRFSVISGTVLGWRLNLEGSLLKYSLHLYSQVYTFSSHGTKFQAMIQS